MTVWVPTLGPRAAFLKPLCSKMLSFDMFFQEFRIPKGFLLSAPCFLCDSEQPQSAPGLTLNIWDAPRLLKSVFLSVSLSRHSAVPRSHSFFFSSHSEKFPHVSRCNRSVLPNILLTLWGAGTGFFHHFSHVWRGRGSIKDAQNASKPDLVFTIHTWKCIPKGSLADLPLKTNKSIHNSWSFLEVQ